MKKLILITIPLILISCCSQELKTYKVKLKLLDGSWTETVYIQSDETPDFKIDCYSYDCGTTGLVMSVRCVKKRVGRPGIIDYKVIN